MFYIYKSYREVLREFFQDEVAKTYILEIDFLNYRLYTYATCTQKMSEEAFDLELRREFRTSTANIIEAFNYLKKIGFYESIYKSAIVCKKNESKKAKIQELVTEEFV